MSDPVRPEQRAFAELDTLVRRLADELASFRRRALVAEARLKDLQTEDGSSASVDLAQRVSELELENERLRSRLDGATAQARQMLDRVRFLRQQAQGSER